MTVGSFQFLDQRRNWVQIEREKTSLSTELKGSCFQYNILISQTTRLILERCEILEFKLLQAKLTETKRLLEDFQLKDHFRPREREGR